MALSAKVENYVDMRMLSLQNKRHENFLIIKKIKEKVRNEINKTKDLNTGCGRNFISGFVW